MQEIAFIGLGNMGLPMARNLAQRGYAVRPYDVNEKAKTAARALGLNPIETITAAVDGADVVFTMLPNGAIVLDVMREISPLLDDDTVVVDCSTVQIAEAKQIHQQIGSNYLDAPVSGGISAAAAGTLTFIVGGDVTTLEQVRPVMDSMGDRIVHCGDAGSGQATKICNNMTLAISMIGTCEALAMGKKLNIKPEAMFDVLSTSTGQCWAVSTYFPIADVGPSSPADNDFKPGFPAKMMVKDMTLAQTTAKEAGQFTPLGAMTLDLYKRYCHSGGAEVDFSGIITYLEDMQGDYR